MKISSRVLDCVVIKSDSVTNKFYSRIGYIVWNS